MTKTAAPADNRFNFDEHVRKYMDTHYIDDPNGYVVWRVGTGGNTELLHLKSFPTFKGHGKRLLKKMLKELLKDPPYHTVYGFCLGSNHNAMKFYAAVGFEITTIHRGVYKEGGAYLFSQEYDNLKEMHGVK